MLKITLFTQSFPIGILDNVGSYRINTGNWIVLEKKDMFVRQCPLLFGIPKSASVEYYISVLSSF